MSSNLTASANSFIWHYPEKALKISSNAPFQQCSHESCFNNLRLLKGG